MLYWAIALVVGYGTVFFIMKIRRGVCTSQADLSGKTVLITGANQGIGYYTALDAATRNAHVIMGCRNQEEGEKAKQRIMLATGNSNIKVRRVDLSCLKSVRKFAEEVNREEQHLHVLVNNAGVTGLPETKTEDGLEYMFATNYFGPFLLTQLLLDLLKKSTPSRIVNVSSIAHKFTRSLDLDNLKSEKSYNPTFIYFNSKLAIVLSTRELAKRLKGSGVSAFSLHPGSVNTDLLKSLPLPVWLIMKVISELFFRSPEEGAQTSIYCMVEESLPSLSGRYFSECQPAQESSLARDDDLAAKLWARTEKIVGIAK